MPSQSSNAGQRVIWHKEYYIHGGDAVFSVENTLFRVHRFFLTRDSSYFRERLPYPASPGETIKGSTDNLPLVLEDITKSDFERFLWVFYNPKYSLYDANIEEWTSILKLAHEWNFIEVKELAIRGLESLQIPALQKVVLYQTYGVDRNRLQTAYTALTVRDEPITIEEGLKLGLETALQIARAREVARAPVFSGRRVGNPRSPVNLADAELHTIINDIFQLTSPDESGHTTQMPTDGGTHNNAQDTSQTGSTAQTNSGSSASNTSQGTGAHANGSTNGSTTNGPPNGHTNGATNNSTRSGRR
ncbi:hypothetical protein EDB87DRAFT_1585278 [Lactarius vividus]|nr:hypothetical protein EDB87DRAFT_1585278 [Lactarius vividus]